MPSSSQLLDRISEARKNHRRAIAIDKSLETIEIVYPEYQRFVTVVGEKIRSFQNEPSLGLAKKAYIGGVTDFGDHLQRGAESLLNELSDLHSPSEPLPDENDNELHPPLDDSSLKIGAGYATKVG